MNPLPHSLRESLVIFFYCFWGWRQASCINIFLSCWPSPSLPSLWAAGHSRHRSPARSPPLCLLFHACSSQELGKARWEQGQYESLSLLMPMAQEWTLVPESNAGLSQVPELPTLIWSQTKLGLQIRWQWTHMQPEKSRKESGGWADPDSQRFLHTDRTWLLTVNIAIIVWFALFKFHTPSISSKFKASSSLRDPDGGHANIHCTCGPGRGVQAWWSFHSKLHRNLQSPYLWRGGVGEWERADAEMLTRALISCLNPFGYTVYFQTHPS